MSIQPLNSYWTDLSLPVTSQWLHVFPVLHLCVCLLNFPGPLPLHDVMSCPAEAAQQHLWTSVQHTTACKAFLSPTCRAHCAISRTLTPHNTIDFMLSRKLGHETKCGWIALMSTALLATAGLYYATWMLVWHFLNKIFIFFCLK